MSLLPRLKDAFERSWPVASLRTYLFAVMLLATLPMAALVSLQIFLDARSDQARIETELARSATDFAQSVQRQLTSSIDGLGVLSQSELFQHGRVAALGRLLQGRPRRDWDSVFLLDRDGSVVLDTGSHRATTAELRELRELQQHVLRDRRAAVSGLSDGQPPGSRAVSVALPVLRNGEPRYVLGARMGEAVWQQLAESAAKPAGGHAAVFDAQDRLIGTSLAAVAPPGALLPRDAAQAMQGQAAGVERSSDVDGQAVYASWETVPASGWRVWVALPATPIDAAYRRALGTAFSTSGASLLLGLLLAALVAQRVARPLRQLARGGGTALQGHVAVREIADLRDALQQAQAQDRAAQRALQGQTQEFALLVERELAARRDANAASSAKDEFLTLLGHELRNPLGAISAAADVLDCAPPDSELAVEARAIIGRQSRNLAHVMNDLLDVGRVMAARVPAAASAGPVANDPLPPSRRRRVLVIEDNDDVLAALRVKLELDGHTVSTATDGIEGLDRLLALRPEVSIVDIGLPGLTGFELAQRARAAGYAGRMIAISGHGAQPDVRAALVAGFDACLVQPVDRDRLRASLRAD